MDTKEMQRLKHSDGPWTPCFSTYDSEIIGFHIAGRPHGSTMPLCESDPKADPETLEGNAHLFAAALELRDALVEADGCFEAALAEGWLEALGDGDIERIRDLWNRRLSHARDLFPSAMAKAGGRP